jgi:hypothetical protein
MRKRHPGASTTTSTRQVNVGNQQQMPQQQAGYGYPPATQQQLYPPQGVVVNPGYAAGYQQPQQQRQISSQQRQGPVSQLLEPVDGGPSVIHRGKIMMKDAITLITLRLAKLEEMTSTPTFNSLMNGEVTGDIDKDDNSEFISNIGERLTNLESNIQTIFQDLGDLKTCLEALVTQTSIDDDQLLLIQSNGTNAANLDDADVTPIVVSDVNQEDGVEVEE